MDEVVDFDLSASKVHLRSKSLSYDYMVIAPSVTTGYFETGVGTIRSRFEDSR